MVKWDLRTALGAASIQSGFIGLTLILIFSNVSFNITISDPVIFWSPIVLSVIGLLIGSYVIPKSGGFARILGASGVGFALVDIVLWVILIV